MLKKNLFVSLFFLSLLAQAEDPPPVPVNPFQNLPSNPDPSSFNPFDDDLEDSPSDTTFSTPSTPSRSTPSTPSSAGQTASRGGSTAANANKGDPASMRDMVDSFDYPDAEILDVAKAISKLTGKNFIYNPQDVKGRISVVSETPITVGDAYNAFLTALNMKGFALVPSGKYLRIERVISAKEKQMPIYSDKRAPNNEEFVTRVIPLRYIDASEFEQTFRLWMPREARMQAYAQTNTLIITDTAIHINRMLELISLLDVAGYQESLVVVPIRNAAAKDIAKLVEQIISDARSSRTANRFNTASRPQTTFSSRTSQSGRTGGVSISKIIADDRTNSLIVKANAAGIVEIKALVKRLDTKINVSEGSGRIHVIRLQFADAETLAKTLSGLSTGQTQQRSTTQARTFTPFGEALNANVFQGDIKIAADKTTQSLVITASPQDFATVKKVVEALDVPRDQVFVQAIIMEMSMNRDSAYGTSFVSAPNGIGLTAASGNLIKSLSGNTAGINGLVLGFKSGRDRPVITLPNNGGNIIVNSLNGLLELVQGNKDANIIATPQIIALDNQKATVEISETIPVESTQINGSVSTNSITQDKAQLLLTVTPQINKASNFVKLDIEQKLENFDSTNVPSALSTRAKGKNMRSTNTSVIVQDEDTVVLSGLIRDSIDEVTNKVPILGDIPILGWLFKNQSTTARKTNLLVFITPKIIKQYDSIRKILENRLSARDDFVREQLGSRDPFGREITKMRKSLPDLTRVSPMPRTQPLDSTSIPQPSSPDREDSMDEMYYDEYGIPPPPPPNVFNADPAGIPPPEFPPPGGEIQPPPPVMPAPGDSNLGDF